MNAINNSNLNNSNVQQIEFLTNKNSEFELIINNLKNEVKILSEKKMLFDNRGWRLFLLISFLLALTAFITTVFVKFDCNLEIISTSLVIAFIGALATFVVVSNFSQVISIKNDVAQTINKVNDEISVLKNQITQINGSLSNITQSILPSSEIIKGCNDNITKMAETVAASTTSATSMAETLKEISSQWISTKLKSQMGWQEKLKSQTGGVQEKLKPMRKRQ
ncbi:MAG: hypothetical protein LBS50_10660 [Prevotellaceae bacterium]|jgi:hypothetical protein|nr:hypothetical protein [Prevotellaceae bacterium]